MFAALSYSYLRVGSFDLSEGHNAILSGLVAITASCAYLEVYNAFVVGFLAYPIYKVRSGECAKRKRKRQRR